MLNVGEKDPITDYAGQRRRKELLEQSATIQVRD
jgi:hypothetical protein